MSDDTARVGARGNPIGGFAPPRRMWNDNTGTTKITAGDFTGDGKTDLVAIWPSGLLRLYAGNGTLNLSTALWGDSAEPDLDKYAREIFTGDGKADLGVLWGGGSLWLAPGNNTGRIDNGLQAIQMWPDNTFYDARQAFAGDHTRDGKTYMGVVWSSSSFWMPPGDGQGHIIGGLQVWPDNAWGDICDLTSGDFTCDGKPDVLALWGDGTLYLYPDLKPL